MKNFALTVVFAIVISVGCSGEERIIISQTPNAEPKFFKADNPNIQYVGRIDFSNPTLPKFWAPGVYIRIRFSGPSCEIELNDELLWGNSHNYISVVVDNDLPRRIKLSTKVNKIKVAENLSAGPHTILICKSTESGMGFLEFVGIHCEKLLPPDNLYTRKIEFIGNSITCAAGSDLSEVACGKGQWYDQHNAYMGYAPLTARSLNSDWMLTAVSGIGLMKSCCELKHVMPDVYDKIDLRENKLQWDFSKFQPDVVTVCLGQNDGIQDSLQFCSNYTKFLGIIRSKYPTASIVCLTSPMADENLASVMKTYIHAVVTNLNSVGSSNVYEYYFKKRYSAGCDTHPTLEEHLEIANELTTFIKQLKHW